MASAFLRNKKVLITGSTGGIGHAIAQRFARKGAVVVLAGRNQAKLDTALASLREHVPAPGFDGTSLPAQTHSTHCFDVREMRGWEDVVAAHVSMPVH